MSHSPPGRSQSSAMPHSQEHPQVEATDTAQPTSPGGVRQPIDRRTGALVRSFKNAFRGIWYLFTTQRNAQIHLLISGCVVALGMVLGLARWEWLVLVLTIGLVLAAEGINTAIEAAVDVATSEYHPLAGVAKDVAAGAVVLCAITAVIVGCLVFVPHLWPLVLNLLDSLFQGS
jgi:diacylglycerol kinase (ATP)